MIDNRRRSADAEGLSFLQVRRFVHTAFASAFVLVLVQLAAAPANHGQGDDDPAKEVLRKARIGTDKQSIIAYLDKLTGDDTDLLRVTELVQLLRSDSFTKRQDASRKLVRLGPAAFAALRPTLRDKDTDAASQAHDCIRKIDASFDSRVEEAAVRTLLRLDDDDSVRCLVRFLPYASDEELQEEIWFRLYEHVKRDRKRAELLVDKLQDLLAARRGLAGCLIARLGNAGQRELSRRLLDDRDPTVRLRTAQGFLGTKDTAGIPVLIKLLQAHPIPIAWQAEELLTWVAGDGAPKLTLQHGKPELRAQCGDAWEKWWRQNNDTFAFNLPEQTYRRPGLAFIHSVFAADYRSVWLCGCNGKMRFDAGALYRTGDVHLRPHGDLLFAGPADKGEPELTERDLDGNISWQAHELKSVVGARQLANGGIVVLHEARADAVSEITPAGTLVNRLRTLEIKGARFTPFEVSRHGVVLASIKREGATEVAEFDCRTGQLLRHVTVASFEPKFDMRVEWSPDGGYLIADAHAGRIIKTDRNGKMAWESKLSGAYFARRLPTGNLAVLVRDRLGGKLVELGPKDNVLAEIFQAGSRVTSCLGLVRLGFDWVDDDEFNLATSVPYRLRGLASKNANLRYRTLLEMETLGAKAPEAFPALFDTLKSSDSSMSNSARNTMVVLSEHLMKQLNMASKDNDPKIRCYVISILGDCTAGSDLVLPTLLETFQDSEPKVRQATAWALGSRKDHDQRAVQALVRALDDSDSTDKPDGWTVSAAAASSLAQFGASADRAIPALIDRLKTSNNSLQHRIIGALGAIRTRPETVIPVLINLLRNDKLDPRIRSSALSSLVRYGSDQRVITALTSVLQDPNDRIRIEAANSLKKLKD